MTKVNNPLTIIAIFASLAEVTGTVVLGTLEKEAQVVFMWFVMFFPLILVSLFFFTLWWKPTSLYAPSDYSNEDNFLDAIGVTEKLSDSIESLKLDLTDLENRIESTEKDEVKTDEIENKIESMKKQLTSSSELIKYISESANSSKYKTLSARVPYELWEEIEELSKENEKPIGVITKEALEKYRIKK